MHKHIDIPDRSKTHAKFSEREIKQIQREKHEEATKNISATLSASYMSRYGNKYKKS